MSEYAELFMNYNYPETKDLCLKFLTLVISILVFSITFSEKIIDFKNSSKGDKRILVFAWISLIFAIILCGMGLAVHALAGGEAVYGSRDSSITELAKNAYLLIVLAGISFIFGLLMITLSGIKFLFREKIDNLKENNEK